jgi:hypothetical protein
MTEQLGTWLVFERYLVGTTDGTPFILLDEVFSGYQPRQMFV